MWANNEVGTLQPVRDLAEICQEAGVVFHVDAVQAAPHLPLELDRIPIHLVSISAHKMYGPKGVGVLVVRGGTPFEPLLTGGGQEYGLRSGTLNVPGIVGLATALTLAQEEREARWLDLAGFACSSGSACKVGVPEPSEVLLAMGYSPEEARGALRVTLGKENTLAEVEAFLDVLPDVVARARGASG